MKRYRLFSIFFLSPICHQILSPTLSSEFISRPVFHQSLAPPNVSSYEEYLWLLQISPAMRNISSSFKYLWLWNLSQFWLLQLSPAVNNISSFFSNVSSYEEYLWLPQISLALKNISSSLKYLWLRRISPALDYFRIHFFLVEMWFKKSWSSRVFFVDWNYASAIMINIDYVLVAYILLNNE